MSDEFRYVLHGEVQVVRAPSRQDALAHLYAKLPPARLGGRTGAGVLSAPAAPTADLADFAGDNLRANDAGLFILAVAHADEPRSPEEIIAFVAPLTGELAFEGQRTAPDQDENALPSSTWVSARPTLYFSRRVHPTFLVARLQLPGEQ